MAAGAPAGGGVCREHLDGWVVCPVVVVWWYWCELCRTRVWLCCSVEARVVSIYALRFHGENKCTARAVDGVVWRRGVDKVR